MSKLFLVIFFVILSIGLFLLWIVVYLFFFEDFKIEDFKIENFNDLNDLYNKIFKNINFRRILFSFIVVLNLFVIFSATLELLMGEWVLFDVIIKIYLFSIKILLDFILKLLKIIKIIRENQG